MAFRIRLSPRWAAPGVAVLSILGIGAVPPMFGSASAAEPDLPVLSPAELLAKARTAQVTGLSGTITLDSRLGLPSLSSLPGLGGGGASSLTGLVSGKHKADVWVDGPQHLRIATAAPMAETNWIRNGDDLWSYDSTTLQSTHLKLGATGTSTGTNSTTSIVPDPAHETPAQFAQDLLDSVTPSTDVSVQKPTYVAGQPAYTLVLTPHSPDSTVQDVSISVDAATGIGLDVRITARSTGQTALDFGFSKVDFGTPKASTFAFTPPPESTVVEATSMQAFLTGGDHVRAGRDRNGRKVAPPAAQVPAPDTSAPESTTNRTKTLGEDWNTVIVLNQASAPSQLDSILGGAPSVTVGGVHGRLLSTSLVNIVFFDDGRIAAGAVTPQVLEATVVNGG